MRPSTLRRLEWFNKGIEILEELKNYKKEDFCEDLKVLSMTHGYTHAWAVRSPLTTSPHS